MTYINHSRSKIKPKSKIKLYELLRSLEGREEVQLKKYLDSPFFTESKFPIRLFNILRENYPGYTQVNREKVFTRLYPGEDFDTRKLNYRYHELYKLVEDFLLQQEFRQSESLQGAARREAYKRKRLYPEFRKASMQEINALPRPNKREADGFEQAFEIYDDIYNHPESISYGSGRDIVRQAVDQLDLQFILQKLKYICDQLARTKTYDEQPDSRFFTAVLEEAAKLKEDYPIIRIFYRLATYYLGDKSEDELREILRQFHELAPQLSMSNQRFLIAKLVIPASIKINANKLSFVEDLFQLLKYGDDSGLYRRSGLVSDATFLNTCTVGARKGEYKWTQAYIERNKPFLPKKSAEEAAVLGEALLLSGKEQYLQALKLLRNLSKKQTPYRLRLHSLTVCCMLGRHLQGEQLLVPLYSYVKAFNRFIYRQNDLSKDRRQAYLNFGKAVLHIAQLRSSNWNDPAERKALLEWMNQFDNLQLRKWLVEQVEWKPEDSQAST